MSLLNIGFDVLDNFDGCVKVHLSVNGDVVLGISTVGVLSSELLLCQKSMKLEGDVTVEDKMLLVVSLLVEPSNVTVPSVVLSADVTTV